MDVYWDDDDNDTPAKPNFVFGESKTQQQQRSSSSRRQLARGRWSSSSGSGGSPRSSFSSSASSPPPSLRRGTSGGGGGAAAAAEKRQQRRQQEQGEDDDEEYDDIQQLPQHERTSGWTARGRLPQQQSAVRGDGECRYGSGVGAAAAVGRKKVTALGESSGSSAEVPVQQSTTAAAEDFEDEEEDEEEAGLGDEVEEQLSSLKQILLQLRDAVSATPAARAAAGRQTAFQHQRKVQRLHLQATTTLAAVDLDLRSVASSLSYRRRAALLQRRQELQQQLDTVMSAYEDLLVQQNVKEIAALHAAAEDAAAADAASGSGDSSALAAGRETLVRLGDEVQDKTQASLHRTRQLVAETEEMGGVVLGKMQQQTEQLQRAGREVDEVETSVARARKTAVSLARNAAGDRFTQCLCLFIFLFLVIAIVLVCVPRGR